jgi:hypothetical protein
MTNTNKKAAVKKTAIRKGQIWADNREKGRELRVEKISRKDGVAVVVNTKTSRVSNIKLTRLQGNGFSLTTQVAA